MDCVDRVLRIAHGPDSRGQENFWHSDVTWREKPSLGSILRAIERHGWCNLLLPGGPFVNALFGRLVALSLVLLAQPLLACSQLRLVLNPLGQTLLDEHA